MRIACNKAPSAASTLVCIQHSQFHHGIGIQIGIPNVEYCQCSDFVGSLCLHAMAMSSIEQLGWIGIATRTEQSGFDILLCDTPRAVSSLFGNVCQQLSDCPAGWMGSLFVVFVYWHCRILVRWCLLLVQSRGSFDWMEECHCLRGDPGCGRGCEWRIPMSRRSRSDDGKKSFGREQWNTELGRYYTRYTLGTKFLEYEVVSYSGHSKRGEPTLKREENTSKAANGFEIVACHDSKICP
mmetsp:Transcript_17555/g.40797  ORF Transcript_17555/g.40797 Transcript_17555/m.40797 type:complete len:239 (+) Transcript_17555:267-983(+)